MRKLFARLSAALGIAMVCSLPAFGSTVTCTGSGDATAINASLAGGGTTTLIGTCGIGSTSLVMNVTSAVLTSTTSARVNYTGSGFAVLIGANGTSSAPVTVNGITFNGGGILTTQNSMSTPQLWVNVTNNIIQNVTNGANGLQQDGYWSHFLVQNNQFNTISTVPIGQVTTATNVENCTGCGPGTPDNYPCSWSGGTNNCFGIGIDLENGYDNTIIDSNSFNFTLGDAMRIPNVWLISSGTSIRIADNNQITNNRFTNIHRMGIEANGGAGCIGSCLYGNYALQTNKVYKDNYISNWLAPYGNSFAWAIGDGSKNPIMANNAAIANTGAISYSYELGLNGTLQFQGNTTTANTGSSVAVFVMSGDSAGPTIYQNLYLAGQVTPGSGGAYFSQEGGCFGCYTQQYNVTAANCDIPSACDTSNATSGIVSFANSGGTATLNTWVKSQLAIRYTQFFLDSATTPFFTQELATINTNFSTDRHWLYGASLSTSGLTGTHTIKALATDLNGGTTTQTQSFTTGSGPVASFSPTTLAYGVITLGNTSAPQTTTLSNPGTAPLTISSGPSLAGTNAADFAITGTTCTYTLAASASCTVTVTFHPLALGSRVASITITDNASGSPHVVSLTGGASICAAGNIVSNCDFSTGALSPWQVSTGSFGSAVVDSTGPGGTFAVHVTATSPVPPGNNIEAPYQDGLTFPANGTMMQAQWDCMASRVQQVNVLGILSTSPFTSYGLAYMATYPTAYYPTYPTCHSPFFKVQGSPTSGSGRLTFQTDNAISGDQLYTTNVNLVPAGSVPASQISATLVAFGPQNVGTTQTASPITITNGGVAGLVISAIGYSTGNPGDFGQTNTCGTLPATVAPGSTCTVTPAFTPTLPGSRASNLVITSNDASVSPQAIPVSGMGVGTTEVVSVFPILVSHGSVYFGFTTQTDSIGVRVRYGTVSCASAPTANNTNIWLETNFLNNIPHTFAALPIGGLPAATTIFICPEVSKDYVLGINPGTWSSGAQLSVTTAALPTPHPALPIPPLTFNTAYPVTTGYTSQSANSISTFSSAYGTGCTNWTAGTGQIINMAAGTVMTTTSSTPFAFTCKPPDLHTVAVGDVTLPSTINWPNHGFAEGDLIEFGRTYGLNVAYPAGGGCDTGKGTTATIGIQTGQRYPVHLIDGSNFQVRCLPTTFIPDPAVGPPTPPVMVWTAAPTASGSDHMVAVAYKSTGNDKNGKPIWQRRMPTSPYAVTPQFIVQSAGNLPPEHTAVTPAWAANLFAFHADSSFISSAAFQHPFIIFGDPDPNVEIPTGPYRFTGCKVETDNYSTVSSDPYFWSTLIWTHQWDDQIIFDRCYYHIPDGNREYRGQQWDGSNQGWVDSYFDNLVYMKSAVVGLAVSGSSHTINITAGSNYIPNLSHYTLASNETITLSGSGSGRVRAYFDLANSGAFTVAVPSGVTASCAPTTCLTPASSPTTSGSCLASIDPTNSATYADLPHYGSGESSAASVGCADLTSGSITAVGPYNTSVSQWNSEGNSHMIGGCGPGPYAFLDNFYDGAGITWHFDDSCGFSFRGNYTWNRNYGKASTKWMYGSPDSLHMVPGNRQQLEWKAGQYAEIKGNVWDGSFRDVIPDSAALAFQPLNGGQVTDFNIVSNTFKNGSAILQGPTNTCGGTASSCGLSMRFHLDNPLTYNINGYFFTSPNPNGSNGPGLGWGNQFSAVEDPFIEHQTDGTPLRGATSWILSNTSVAVEGYTDINSIHFFNGEPTQVTSQYGDGSGQAPGVPPGCSSLSNFALMNCQFTPSYLFKNLLLGGYTDNSVPSGQSTVSTMTTAFGSVPNVYLANGTVAGTIAAVGWLNPTIDQFANYCLAPASPYKAGNNSITHAADLGVNCNRLIQDQGIVDLKGTPANLITTSGFSVSYVAADSAVDYVGYSTTNDVTTATWVADGGGARPRNTAITGRSTKTHYYYWVYGSGNFMMSQKSGDVWTN